MDKTCCHSGKEQGSLTQALVAALEQKKPWTLDFLAREFHVTEMKIAESLPEGMCSFCAGEEFVKVWEALGAWEKSTFMVQHDGHVFEIRCGRLPAGKTGFGFYNITDETSPLVGHLNPASVARIAFLSMPFMGGMESLSVQFFNAEGKVSFSIYAGRENHVIIPEVKESFLSIRKEMTGA